MSIRCHPQSARALHHGPSVILITPFHRHEILTQIAQPSRHLGVTAQRSEIDPMCGNVGGPIPTPNAYRLAGQNCRLALTIGR